MREPLLRRIATIVGCLALALAFTLLAYLCIAHPQQQVEDVPEVVVEVLDRASGETVGETTVGNGEAESPSVQAQGSDDGGDAAVAQSPAGLTVTEDGERVFIMPEGVPYVEGVALLQVGDGASAQDVAQLLAETPGAVAREVSDDEVASGIIEVEIAEGASVEDVVNELLASPVAEAAQPNFEYVVMLGDEADLREQLAESLDFEPQPDFEPDLAVGEELPTDMGEASAVESAAPDDEEAATDHQVAEEADRQASSDVGEPGSQQEGSSEGETPVEEGLPSSEAPQEGPDVGAGAEDGAATDVTVEFASDELGSVESNQPDPKVGDAGDVAGQKAGEGVADESASDLLAAVSLNDPLLKDSSSDPAADWALVSVRAYQAWGIAKCSQKVTVAVLDTGFQADHEDLGANVRVAYNAVEGTSDVSPIKGVNYNHGTHVAGVVAAKANNGVGVAGVSYDAGLMLIKVASSTGQLTTTNLVKAYDYVMANAATYNVRVVNVSMGINTTKVDVILNGRINQAYEQGIVTVAASGNSDITGGVVPYAEYPGDEGNVVSTINLQPDGNSVSRYSTSNYNLPGMRNKNVSAPGTSILSTVPTNNYSRLTGTSMAAPYVSGILALEFAAKPSLTAGEAVSCLYASAADIGPKGFDEEYGWGEVDAYAALYLAKNGAVPDGTQDDQAAAADAVAAAEVQAKIEVLPDAADVTRAHAPAIRSVRASYNALTSAQKKLVNIERLTAAEQALNAQTATVTRLAGQNAYDTMRIIMQSSSGFASGRGGTVIVATGEGYWDALAASGLAGLRDAPVLITAKSALSTQAKSELQRLKPTEVLVMGGAGAISNEVLTQIKAACGMTPKRVCGNTAPDTAITIYEAGKGSWGKTAIVATANGYWDALSVAPFAYAKGAPIFLTKYSEASEGRKLTDSALKAIKDGGFTRVLVIGGPAAIPTSVEEQLKSIGIPTVKRLRGTTAIDTSVAVAQLCLDEGMVANGMGVATSNGYWDALTGAALCGRNDAVLVLAANEKSPSITTFVKANRADIAQLYVFGGRMAVSSESEAAIKAALK